MFLYVCFIGGSLGHFALTHGVLHVYILFFWSFRGSWGHIDGSFFRSRLRREGHHLVKLQCTFGKTAMDFFRLFIKKNRAFSKQICLNLSYVRATCELLASKYS